MPWPRSSTRGCWAPAGTTDAALTTATAARRRVIGPSLEIELADERLHQRAAGRVGGRFPVRPAREREEALLGEILLEHVEALGHQGERSVSIRQLFEQRHRQRRVPQRDGCEGERDGCARRILRWNADVDERLRRFAVSGYRQCGEPGGRAAQQFLEPFVLVRELEHLDEIADVRLAVDPEETNGGGDRR